MHVAILTHCRGLDEPKPRCVLSRATAGRWRGTTSRGLVAEGARIAIGWKLHDRNKARQPEPTAKHGPGSRAPGACKPGMGRKGVFHPRVLESEVAAYIFYLGVAAAVSLVLRGDTLGDLWIYTI
jgi:hypothetical protein